MLCNVPRKYIMLRTKICCRQLANVAANTYREDFKTSVWQIHSYGGLENVQNLSVRSPIIKNPNNVLVKVDAASVNPIDLLMCSGYGRTLINVIRKDTDLPLTLGRDFCGTIISKGHAVDSRLKVGTRVYGFKPLHQQGTFSEVIDVSESYVCVQPKHLSHIESASLVYAAMTAWSGLFITGGLLFKKRTGVRVLLLGASGGVGTCAIQLLKSQGCMVYATCSEDAFPLVRSLGADAVYNYKDVNFYQDVASEGRFHIILDCAKFGNANIPQSWSYDIYVALNSPLLVNADKYGLMQGLCTSASDLVRTNVRGFGRKNVRWGFFMPLETGFNFLNNLIVNKKIQPTIHKVFKFSQLPEAFKTAADGHLRGKIVVDFT